MFYTQAIHRAIRFSIKTHEVYQKQKRKGKDVAYIVHPLTVGMILARAGADEDVVVAGILHDTIEDSVPDKKVSEGMIAKRFGGRVAAIVSSVSEIDASWEERKADALARIAVFSHESVLVKSADIIANLAELTDDVSLRGVAVFDNFASSKERMLEHQAHMVDALIDRWAHNPLLEDLKGIRGYLEGMRS